MDSHVLCSCPSTLLFARAVLPFSRVFTKTKEILEDYILPTP